MRKLLAKFNIGIGYRDHRGVFQYRYGGNDYAAGRPMHEGMSVAYPNAKMFFFRMPPA